MKHNTWTKIEGRRGYSRTWRLSCLGRTQSTWLESKGKTRLWRTGQSCCWRRPCSVHCWKSWGGLCWQKYSGSKFRYSIYGWSAEVWSWDIIVICWPFSAHANKNDSIRPHCPLPHWSITSVVRLSPRSPYVHLFFTQPRAIQMTQKFHILAEITKEPPALRTCKCSHALTSYSHSLNVNPLEFT